MKALHPTLPLVLLSALLLSACVRHEHFRVEGTITGAEGKMLYLEAATLEGVEPMDSMRLKAAGNFHFSPRRPENPEFYRLRVDDRVVNFAIDSTETLTITGDYPTLSTDYTPHDSPDNQHIKELVLLQMALQQKGDRIMKAARERTMPMNAARDSIRALLQAYKDTVRTHYIFTAPDTKAAYFALFQRLGTSMIFDPLNDRDDIKCFAAVATSLNHYYPHAIRSKNLYNIVIKGMKHTRQLQQEGLEVDASLVSETGVIDINLRDLEGNPHRLSDLRGRVVILDFTLYQTTASAAHNYALREVYDRYAPQGLLEIYQVSLDEDEHFWKVVADNLPWICVRDANALYSSYATAYDVSDLPTTFLINRNNELSQRLIPSDNLQESVEALLK